MRSPDFGIVAGLAILVLLCASLPYMSIISALVFGTGMCLAMGQIGSGTTSSFVLGIAIGVVGMIGMGVNYPIHKKLLAQGKQKYAFEIMELAKEISER